MLVHMFAGIWRGVAAAVFAGGAIGMSHKRIRQWVVKKQRPDTDIILSIVERRFPCMHWRRPPHFHGDNQVIPQWEKEYSR